VGREFMPGLDLARLFYTEIVRPLLDAEFPGLTYSAALIGWGSDVLGYDSLRSTDHNWGPRLQVLLDDEAGAPDRADAITAMLAARLPAQFRGYPTIFAIADVPGAVPAHWVEVAGLRDWLTCALGFDPTRPIQLIDWLATPTQILAEVTGGAVFHDGLPAVADHASDSGDEPPGALATVRRAVAWYPDDLWRYVLACQWQRISQEEPFPGRCAEAGDDLGSAVVAARLARDLMRLVLLMERRYPPYSKWLGTAFARTRTGAAMLPPLTAAVASSSWPERERSLCAAYEIAASRHNELGLTAALDPAVRPRFHSRPYRVLEAERFAAALRGRIGDAELRALPPIGAVDQFVDSTDAVGNRAILRAAVTAELDQASSRT
jgi:hypothetical protein